MDQFVYQMYACGLFEAKLLDNWEESTENLWGATPPQFTKQYPKERRKLEREQAHKNFERSVLYEKRPAPTPSRHPTEEKPPKQRMIASQQQWNTPQC